MSSNDAINTGADALSKMSLHECPPLPYELWEQIVSYIEPQFHDDLYPRRTLLDISQVSRLLRPIARRQLFKTIYFPGTFPHNLLYVPTGLYLSKIPKDAPRTLEITARARNVWKQRLAGRYAAGDTAGVIPRYLAPLPNLTAIVLHETSSPVHHFGEFLRNLVTLTDPLSLSLVVAFEIKHCPEAPQLLSIFPLYSDLPIFSPWTRLSRVTFNNVLQLSPLGSTSGEIALLRECPTIKTFIREFNEPWSRRNDVDINFLQVHRALLAPEFAARSLVLEVNFQNESFLQAYAMMMIDLEIAVGDPLLLGKRIEPSCSSVGYILGGVPITISLRASQT